MEAADKLQLSEKLAETGPVSEVSLKAPNGNLSTGVGLTDVCLCRMEPLLILLTRLKGIAAEKSLENRAKEADIEKTASSTPETSAKASEENSKESVSIPHLTINGKYVTKLICSGCWNVSDSWSCIAQLKPNWYRGY